MLKQQIQAPFTISSSSTLQSVVPYHTHYHYELYYFYSGKVNYLINDRIYILEPGDLLLMHGMTLHRANVDPSVLYHRCTIHFDPHYFKNVIQPSFAPDLLLPFKKLQNVRLQMKGERRTEIEALLHKLEQLHLTNTAVAKQRVQAVFLELMIIVNELCERSLLSIPALPSAKAQHVQSIMTYIEEQYSEDITLEKMQAALHLSKFYLAKTFKEVTGITIFQYLMQRRIYQAKISLIDSELPITDVGYSVGFKHPSHFSRAFKLQTDFSPEQYRKQYQLNSPF